MTEKSRLQSFLPPFNRDFLSIFSADFIWGFGAGMVGLFLPIFLFKGLGSSIFNVIYFYLASFVLFAFLVPLGAEVMERINLKRSMIFSLPALAIYYLAFYFFNISDKILILVPGLLAITLFRILYWVPYHIDIAKFGDKTRRATQIAYFSSISFTAEASAPLLAGFIIEKFGFSIIFFGAAVLAGLAMVPLFFLAPIKEEYTFSYFQTFRELFSRKNWRILIGYGSWGAEEMTGLVIWPVFIFGILKESYSAVGIVTAAILFSGTILRIIIGRLADGEGKRKLFINGTLLYSIGWIFRMLVASGFEVFLAGAYHSFAGIIRGVPLAAFQYEQMHGKGHFIDEYTVLREVAINIGRIIMLLGFLVLLSFVGVMWTFVLAAIASFLIRFL
ncbi:MAG: hypothetical protein HYW70_01855 [Candidatus Nealsonbacteria bacterium]|nr:hypothetical protein [Candidatus Nealsonbacteria bacterium]